MGENDIVPQPQEEIVDPPKEGEDVDYYKTELEKVTKKAGDLEKDNARLGFLLRKKEEEPEELAEEDKPVTKGELKKIISQTTRQTLEGQYEAMILKRASSENEANLIRHYLYNSVVLSGNVEEDVDNAYTLANKGKTKQVLSELTRAKGSEGGSGTGSGQRLPSKKFPQPKWEDIDESERKLIQYNGMKWNSDTGTWEMPK